MTKASMLITDALGSLGVVGSTAVTGNDATLGLRVLNRMLDGWRQDADLAVCSTWLNFTLPASTATRTIGPTGQVVAERPVELEIGSFTRINGIDMPLGIAERDEYARIDLKTLATAWPQKVYYEATAPNGTLYFWPLAGSAGASVFLAVRTQLTAFADLTTAYTLPDGYEAAIVPSLAVKLAPYFERAVPASVARDAYAARYAIGITNAMVPQLDLGGGPRMSAEGRFMSGV